MPRSASAEITTGLDIYIPFAERLGVRVLYCRVGDVGLELQLSEEHMNTWQMAHGGVIMSVLDIAMGMCAKTIDDACEGATTVEMKTNFLKPATGRIVARALAHSAGRSLVFAESELRNQTDDLLAKASGTFKLRYPRPGSE